MDTILVVEDDPQSAMLLGAFCEQEGYPVIIAATGAEARTALGGHAIALVLLDLRLPDVDGVELMREIRQASRTASPRLCWAKRRWKKSSGLRYRTERMSQDISPPSSQRPQRGARPQGPHIKTGCRHTRRLVAPCVPGGHEETRKC